MERQVLMKQDREFMFRMNQIIEEHNRSIETDALDSFIDDTLLEEACLNSFPPNNATQEAE